MSQILTNFIFSFSQWRFHRRQKGWSTFSLQNLARVRTWRRNEHQWRHWSGGIFGGKQQKLLLWESDGRSFEKGFMESLIMFHIYLCIWVHIIFMLNVKFLYNMFQTFMFVSERNCRSRTGYKNCFRIKKENFCS